MSTLRNAAAVFAALTFLQTGSAVETPAFDLVVSGGRIVDGAGNAWYRADIGIRNGKIAEIGKIASRGVKRVIDAHDQVVAPGFIDMMGASSIPLLLNRKSAESKLRQGITTLLAGEGDSAAPQNDRVFDQQAADAGYRWQTFGQYFHLLEQKGIPMNVTHNVGAAQIRRIVIGDEDREPTPRQLEQMQALVAEAMQDGVVGLSTALIYPPGTYARTAELVLLAQVVGQYGGSYMSHMRNESGKVLDAIRETIHIGEAAGIPTHIFHLKAAGEENWPLMKDSLALIQSARDRGLDVTADIYPYIRNGIGLTSFLHPRHYASGAAPFLATLKDPAVRSRLRKEVEDTSDWENWYRHVGRNWDNVLVVGVGPDANGHIDRLSEGRSIAEIARARGVDDWTAFFDLVESESVTVNPKSMNEEQKFLALRTPWVSLCTDESPIDTGTATYAHPRAFGSFVRVLAKYVREEKILTLESAVRQMSALPANFLGLYDRGRIAPGMAADLLVFDPEKVQDTATFQKPLSFPTGMPYVIVNGNVIIDDGRFTGVNAGAVLRFRNGRKG